ncbi:hypothetical protein ACZ11_14210 [Lysinibacillus xylanilyticus]|uniref:Permease n=1 Tax=Lysinibacillus xylanilyticus TaxID=582475 RepID=A0A0K9F9L3_9BACI|nr:hypothetical protein [Lysinibacillus xylanilyticus]KMY30786.1 hypothetical protein ACZ11_14210 [Lysinibacillus xylanilyticus]
MKKDLFLNTSRNSRIAYLFSGIVCTVIGIYINIPAITSNYFSESYILLAIGIGQIMLAYLAPHIFPNDERSEKIVGRAMYINYFVLFIMLFVLYSLISSDIWILSGVQLLIIIFSVMVVSIPATMIIYTKKY